MKQLVMRLRSSKWRRILERLLSHALLVCWPVAHVQVVRCRLRWAAGVRIIQQILHDRMRTSQGHPDRTGAVCQQRGHLVHITLAQELGWMASSEVHV